jgi:large subunit ribosomal protein L10
LALSKETKVEIYNRYLKVLEKTQGIIVAEYRGMTMPKFNDTRKALRAANGKFMVTKNTIFLIALREMGFAAPEELFTGPVTVALAFGDLPTLTKAMLQRAKEEELIKLKGAVMGTSVFRADQLEMVSTMPTLKEAQAGLLGTLVAPATTLLSVLGQPATNVAAILQAYKDKLDGGQVA